MVSYIHKWVYAFEHIIESQMHQLFHLKALIILKRKNKMTKNNKIMSFVIVLILSSALDMKLHTPNIY